MGRPLRSLTRTERDAYFAVTEGTHHRRIEVEVFRRDPGDKGKAVLSLTDRFLGGSVQGDTDQSPVTRMECDLFDPGEDLDWGNGEHRKFEVRVLDSRFVPSLNDWVTEPVFRGPMWSFDRSGELVRLVCHGGERNAMGSIRRAESYPAKARATVVLKGLLRSAGAQPSDLDVPDLNRTLPRAVTVGVKLGKPPKGDQKDTRKKVQRLKVNREDTYWGEALKIAQALGRDLFADGRGKLVLEATAKRPTLRLTNRHILSPVKVTRGDDGETVNTWIVLGPNPEGPRGRPSARVGLPRRHPSSAETLAWNGTPRPIIETTENRHVKSDREARKLAERRRDRALRETVRYEVSALPVIPWVRPDMVVSVPVGGGRAGARASAWSLPLGPGADPLTFGTTARRGAS